MKENRRFLSGFSEMTLSELKQQKQLWNEAKKDDCLMSEASDALREINLTIHEKWTKENAGRIIIVSLYILMLVTLTV